jgi:hypothetical protein
MHAVTRSRNQGQDERLIMTRLRETPSSRKRKTKRIPSEYTSIEAHVPAESQSAKAKCPVKLLSMKAEGKTRKTAQTPRAFSTSASKACSLLLDHRTFSPRRLVVTIDTHQATPNGSNPPEHHSHGPNATFPSEFPLDDS